LASDILKASEKSRRKESNQELDKHNKENLTFMLESTRLDDPIVLILFSWSVPGNSLVLSVEKKSTSLVMDLVWSPELSFVWSETPGFCRRKSPEWKNTNSRPCLSMSKTTEREKQNRYCERSSWIGFSTRGICIVLIENK
jgi:hypothetical protein